MASTTRLPLLAGVDGSALSLRATRWAAREAARREVPLRLLHVCGSPNGPCPDDSALRYGERSLRAAEEAAERAAPGLSVQPLLEAGDAAQSLVAHSAEAGLVALGASGVEHDTTSLLGLVARTVTARAESPVVVHRGLPEHTTPGGAAVVVGTDAADHHGALDFAFAAADARACPLIAVWVWDGYEPDESARSLLAERFETWAARYPGVLARLRFVRGRHPGQALVRAASTARLVVLGSRLRPARAQPVLGITTHELLDHAPCPVAVVPPLTRFEHGNGTE
ncbi:universal stress protein [Amycolatopsis sp. NPDC059027]|uniref:universal stress protein n=1 Tax=unclassified Amycolatopsis TaxID=2618356 RepID=UPI00366C695B